MLFSLPKWLISAVGKPSEQAVETGGAGGFPEAQSRVQPMHTNIAGDYRTRSQRGFSLIELLLVVAIIMIIASIAIPSYLRNRMAANEASAVASMHSIDTAQVSYSSTYPEIGFAPDLNSLGPGANPGNTNITSANACLLDNVLGCSAGVGTASCSKSGYSFAITAGTGTPISTYSTNGNPLVPTQTGDRYFYSDNSAVIRNNTTAIATANDQAIQ